MPKTNVTETEMKRAMDLMTANYYTVAKRVFREGDVLMIEMHDGAGGTKLPPEIHGIEVRRVDPPIDPNDPETKVRSAEASLEALRTHVRDQAEVLRRFDRSNMSEHQRQALEEMLDAHHKAIAASWPADLVGGSTG
jgi:hypothetical protein